MEVDLAGFGMEKEITIYHHEITCESDIFMLSKNILQYCLNRAGYMLWLDTSALSLENFNDVLKVCFPHWTVT